MNIFFSWKTRGKRCVTPENIARGCEGKEVKIFVITNKISEPSDTSTNHLLIIGYLGKHSRLITNNVVHGPKCPIVRTDNLETNFHVRSELNIPNYF